MSDSDGQASAFYGDQATEITCASKFTSEIVAAPVTFAAATSVVDVSVTFHFLNIDIDFSPKWAIDYKPFQEDISILGVREVRVVPYDSRGLLGYQKTTDTNDAGRIINKEVYAGRTTVEYGVNGNAALNAYHRRCYGGSKSETDGNYETLAKAISILAKQLDIKLQSPILIGLGVVENGAFASYLELTKASIFGQAESVMFNAMNDLQIKSDNTLNILSGSKIMLDTKIVATPPKYVQNRKLSEATVKASPLDEEKHSLVRRLAEALGFG
jgi:hypothetical protein